MNYHAPPLKSSLNMTSKAQYFSRVYESSSVPETGWGGPSTTVCAPGGSPASSRSCFLLHKMQLN